MIKHNTLRNPFVALASIGGMLLIGPRYATAARSWMTIIPEQNQDEMVAIRLVGLQSNKSQAQDLTKQLESPPSCWVPSHRRSHHVPDIDNEYRLALMHALAQIGAMTAVPEVDNITQTNKDRDVVA